MAMDNDQGRPPQPEGEDGEQAESAWHFEPESLGRKNAPQTGVPLASSETPGESHDAAPQQLRPRSRAEDAAGAEAVNGANQANQANQDPDRPRMSWDEMVATPAESGSMLEAMRQWADKSSDEDEPRRGRRLLGEVEIQQASARTQQPESAGAPADSQAEQGGGRLSRLFGRKKRDEAASSSAATASGSATGPAIGKPATSSPPASEPLPWGDRLTFKEPHAGERPARAQALPAASASEPRNLAAEVAAFAPPENGPTDVSSGVSEEASGVETEPAWLTRLRKQTGTAEESTAAEPAFSSPEMLRDDPPPVERRVEAQEEPIEEPREEPLDDIREDGQDEGEDAWSGFKMPDVLDHYRDPAAAPNADGVAESAGSGAPEPSLTTQLDSIEALASGSFATHATERFETVEPTPPAIDPGGDPGDTQPITDERILRWPGKRLPPAPDSDDGAPVDWNSSGLFDGYDEPAESRPETIAPPREADAEPATVAEPRPATFAEALAQLDEQQIAAEDDDDPWKAVAEFERPELAEPEPVEAAPSPSILESHPAFTDHHDDDDWDTGPQNEPTPIDAIRSRDLFGFETTFDEPRRGVLSRWGERMREESSADEWRGLTGEQPRAASPTDRADYDPGEPESGDNSPSGIPSSPEGGPRRIHPMQDPAQYAENERVPGRFDAILGRDADNLLREIDAERIDSARRSPTLRARPGVTPDDPLWRMDEEDHERRYLRGDFDDPHDAQPDAEGAAALPLFGGAAFGEHEGSGDAAGSRSSSKAWVREVVETGLLALLVFLAVRASFQNFKVDGHSMDPTLEDGQLIIVNKLIYSDINVDKLGNFLPFIDTGSSSTRALFHGPQRGDIVVLVDPRHSNQDLIKRVIGLPGETVEVSDGKVYINDQLLIEPYIKAQWHDTKAKQTIPAGEYFVMGDNRDNSLDSRAIGPVAKELIIGKAMLSYWPSSQFGLAPNEEGKLTAKDAAPKLSSTRIGDK